MGLMDKIYKQGEKMRSVMQVMIADNRRHIRPMNRQGMGVFIVLLPTLECNLQCAYCFESHPKGRWSIAETRQILEKIFAYLAHRHITECRFHWQGGNL